MLKKVITYTNPFTGQEVSEEHYFHISKADLVEMQMEEHNTTYTKDGQELAGMSAKLQRVMDSGDGRAIMFEFKDFIRRSYGRKNGDRFLKSPEIWEEFCATEAYSQLIFELCTDAEAAGEFINGIIPHNLDQLAEEIRERAEASQNGSTPSEVTPIRPNLDTSEKTVAEGQSWDENPERELQLAAATTDDPVTLTQADLAEMDSDDLKSGLATGRYKLS